MILANARLIFHDCVRDGLEVVVEEGKIAAIREQTRLRSRRRPKTREVHACEKGIFDLSGNYLAPGFIDLHVHGALGRDTMEASGEAFQAICAYHVSGGTTSLLLTTATAPMDKLVEVLKAVRDCVKRRAWAGTARRAVRTPQRGVPTIAGVHLEGPFISKAKRGAQRAEFIRRPSQASVQQLLDHANVIKRITIAPEVPGALEAIEDFYRHGISVSGGHSDAWDDEAREGFARGMRSVTHTFNCMSSARRRGIYRVAGLLEFALSEPRISCELIGDAHHVSVTLMKMLYRAKGPRGICLVTDATAGAGLPNGSQFSLFGTDCLVEGGVCLLADRSALAGSASRMIDLVRTMVMKVNVPLHEAVAMATANPAREIGLTHKGHLEVGADADFLVLSPELDVSHIFVGGEEICCGNQE